MGGRTTPSPVAGKRHMAWTPLEQKKNANRKFAFFFFLAAHDQREWAVPPR